MEIAQTSIPNCFQLFPEVFRDARGSFVKTFYEPFFRKHGMETNFAEEYYTASCKGALRGLHFQVPPVDHVKIVCCVAGSVLDVVLDLRVGSPTYGEYAMFELNGEDGGLLYIPQGLAHGFYAISDHAVMSYKVTTAYSREHDTGILWNSAGIPWPDSDPVVSSRDQTFLRLADFRSPFKFND